MSIGSDPARAFFLFVLYTFIIFVIIIDLRFIDIHLTQYLDKSALI